MIWNPTKPMPTHKSKHYFQIFDIYQSLLSEIYFFINYDNN